MGAEPLIAAEKDDKRIAVEIKSFINVSQLYDFYEALGQFKFYWHALRKNEPDRILYLAVSTDLFSEFFDDQFIEEVRKAENLLILVFDIEREIVAKWIN